MCEDYGISYHRRLKPLSYTNKSRFSFNETYNKKLQQIVKMQRVVKSNSSELVYKYIVIKDSKKELV